MKKNHLSKPSISSISLETSSPKIGINSIWDKKYVNKETKIVAPKTQPKPEAKPLNKLIKIIYQNDLCTLKKLCFINSLIVLSNFSKDFFSVFLLIFYSL